MIEIHAIAQKFIQARNRQFTCHARLFFVLLSYFCLILFFLESTGEIWLKKKDEDDIIPIELTERDFTTLPPVEIKSDGPVFGSNAGKMTSTRVSKYYAKLLLKSKTIKIVIASVR